MNDKELRELNPWSHVDVDDILRTDVIEKQLDSANAYVSRVKETREKKSEIEVLNSLGKKNDKYRFHFELPPEPWQGNPLTAKVVILTLNPGYVKEANIISAKLLKSAGWNEELSKYKKKVLDLEAESLMPEIKATNDIDKISLFDAFNTLGDWYWVDKLKDLRDAYIAKKKGSGMNDIELENEFYSKIAIVEYCAYTSQCFSDSTKIENLPTVEFIKDLVWHIEANKKALFVILRAKGKWEAVLHKGTLDDSSRCVVNNNISQNLSRNNLKLKEGSSREGDKEPFDIILDKLLEEKE